MVRLQSRPLYPDVPEKLRKYLQYAASRSRRMTTSAIMIGLSNMGMRRAAYVSQGIDDTILLPLTRQGQCVVAGTLESRHEWHRSFHLLGVRGSSLIQTKLVFATGPLVFPGKRREGIWVVSI